MNCYGNVNSFRELYEYEDMEITTNDDNLIELSYDGVLHLKGISLGDRLFNFIDKGLVLDLTNGLCSYITMNPEELGFFESFFKTKKSFPDYFRGNIVEIKDVSIDENGGNHKLKKNAKTYGNIEGEWTSFISFDGVEYWNNNIKTLNLFVILFCLSS